MTAIVGIAVVVVIAAAFVLGMLVGHATVRGREMRLRRETRRGLRRTGARARGPHSGA